jgi:hypothetical protein
MQGMIYEESSIWTFLFVTILLGGGAAWMTGRSVAQAWGSIGLLVIYLLLLGAGIRFIHHALYGGTMFSLHYYIVDTIVVFLFGLVAYRFTRAGQMASQYSWLYERSGPFSWRPRT